MTLGQDLRIGMFKDVFSKIYLKEKVNKRGKKNYSPAGLHLKCPHQPEPGESQESRIQPRPPTWAGRTLPPRVCLTKKMMDLAAELKLEPKPSATG